jgi:hypothetical protein
MAKYADRCDAEKKLKGTLSAKKGGGIIPPPFEYF